MPAPIAMVEPFTAWRVKLTLTREDSVPPRSRVREQVMELSFVIDTISRTVDGALDRVLERVQWQFPDWTVQSFEAREVEERTDG